MKIRFFYFLIVPILCGWGSASAVENHTFQQIPLSLALKTNQSPGFPPLSKEEVTQPWGKELLLAIHYLKQGDFPKGETALSHASVLSSYFLAPSFRKEQIAFTFFILSYLQKNYPKSAHSGLELLGSIPNEHPVYSTTLILTTDSLFRSNQEEQQKELLNLLSLQEKELFLEYAHFLEKTPPSAKSPLGTAFLNGILPGLGFFYIGQITTALTAFIVNLLFFKASWEFYRRKMYGTALLFLTLEVGWYGGGILGGFIGANGYNDAAFKQEIYPEMVEKKLFPLQWVPTKIL